MAFATPKLLIGIASIMGGIYAVDQFLARLEQREIGAQARHFYESAAGLERQGHRGAAIEAFQRAHVLDRDNDTYTLALASALIEDHQTRRAVEILSEILDYDSNDGQANLLMARAMNQEGNLTSADSYYHRAIYGSWTGGASEHVQARLELVHWLAQRGEAKELLAELIPLDDSAKTYPQIARELPQLYERAGSPSRAVEAFRALIHSSPNDPDAYAGLGHAELEDGDYHAARQAFQRAADLKPEDTAFRHSTELATQALDLDPTPRRLSSGEKLARSNGILELASGAIAACAAGQPGWGPDSPLLKSAYALTGEKKTPATNESAEVRLDYAMRIWNSRPAVCDTQTGRTELLAVLVRKIAQ
jgi:tetratricopeptide (TPR) repeat protein